MITVRNMILLLVVLFSFACTKSNLADEGVINTDNGSAAASSVNKTLMLQLVNDIRKKGCQCEDTYYSPAPAVTWNSLLEQAAAKHSSDMYANKYFSHTGLNGSNGGTRIQQAGYNWMSYGENIAMGFQSEREVVESWLESAGHCRNIMNKNFKEMGVAKTGAYWVQEFGSR